MSLHAQAYLEISKFFLELENFPKCDTTPFAFLAY